MKFQFKKISARNEKLNNLHTLAGINEQDVGDTALYKLKTLYPYHLLVLHHSYIVYGCLLVIQILIATWGTCRMYSTGTIIL